MKKALKKVLVLLLTLTTILSVFASCAPEQDLAESGSDSSEQTNVEDEGASEDGLIQVFANGEYTAKIIRGEMANALEKEIYNKIKELFKNLTKVNPPISTDFVAANEELYNGPAILIGQTDYAESKAAYKKLSDDQATATISGNKYVIAFDTADAAEKLITTLKTTLNKKASKEEIKIDSTWKISTKADTSSSGNETFDDTGLIKSVNVNSLELGTAYNAGQGSKTYIKKNATQSTFTDICKNLESNGVKKYTTNNIGTNLYATYVTKEQIIHVMFFPNLGEVRTAVDKRGEGMNGFSLPGLSGENKYTKKKDSEMIVCDISNADWPGGMCIIFKLADGRFFIIDAGIGGKMSDGRSYVGSSSGWIYATLAKHADDPKNIKVAGWLITHVHSDHAGGLYDMALGYHGKKGGAKHTVMPKDIKKYVTIEQIVYNAPDNFPDCNREGWMKTIIEGFNVKNVVKAHPGQVLYYADLTITVYGALDVMLENAGKSGDLNDFSLVVRAEFNGKSILFLGDSDTIPNPVLAKIYKGTLKSDMLQLAHHGYGDTGDSDVNSYCDPSMVLWVVANADLRSNYKINVNSNISKLSGVKNYKPGTGNLIFKKDWSTYTESRSTICNLIPNCDGSICGYSNCQTNTSFKNAYT